MFPYTQSEGTGHDEQDKFLDNLFADCEALCDNIEIENEGAVEKRQRRASPPSADGTQKNDHSSNFGGHEEARKSMHRDTERQRRKEMAGLYASLRSLLPLEYIKGKRAVTDQLNQAANYIKHMQTKIGKMQMRRRDLEKKLSGAADKDPHKPCLNNRVAVDLCLEGMEILISSEANDGALSKVFAVLLGISDELNVISCVSTRPGPGQFLLHRIQIEVNDPEGVDLFQIQKRLVNVIN